MHVGPSKLAVTLLVVAGGPQNRRDTGKLGTDGQGQRQTRRNLNGPEFGMDPANPDPLSKSDESRGEGAPVKARPVDPSSAKIVERRAEAPPASSSETGGFSQFGSTEAILTAPEPRRTDVAPPPRST